VRFADIGYGWSGIVKTYNPARPDGDRNNAIDVKCSSWPGAAELALKPSTSCLLTPKGNELEALNFPFGKVPCRMVSIEVLVGPGRRRDEGRRGIYEAAVVIHKHWIGENTLILMLEPDHDLAPLSSRF